MIFVTTLTPDEKLEKRLFESWDVAVAARYFRCVKIFADDIESKADRERFAKVTPAIIFLDGSGRETSRLTGAGPSAPTVYSGMQKASGSTFKKPLVSLVEGYTAFLKKFDKVQGRVSELEFEIAEDLAHVTKHDCAPGRKQLKEHEEEIKPLQAERDKLLEQEQALLKPDPKPKATAAAEK
jgi:hypothetical protein